MNIIPLSGESLTMSSREIAELTGKRHDHVMRDIRTLLVELHGEQGLPSFGASYINEQNKAQPCFNLPKRESLILVSGYSIRMRAAIIDRWQELESSSAQPPAIPQTLPEALRLAAEAIERNEKLALENKAQAEALNEQAPKVAFARQVEVAPDAIDVCKAAQLLGTGRNRLMQFLREKHWVTRYNQPYQDKIDAGLLNTKLSRPYEHPERGLQQSVTTLVTGKGLVKLRQLWDERKQEISDAWMLSKSANNQEVRHAR